MKNLLTLVLILSISPQVFSQVRNLGAKVNSKYHEIRPLITGDGKTLYFTVEGNPISKYKKGQDIWVSEKGASGEWEQARRFPDSLNNNRYNGVFWTSRDGNTLLIRTPGGFSRLEKKDTAWTTPTPLAIKNYNKLSRGIYSGATMSPDQKVLILYFSDETNSDINDLWISQLDTTTAEYSEPVKLPLSEDQYDEIAPYIAPDGKTLYYSTDKEGGLGSNDIWMSRRLDDTWQTWSLPVNIGAPINTKKWDAYFSVDEKGKAVYIATNRKYNLPGKVGGADIAFTVLPDSLLPLPVEPQPLVKDTVTIHDTVYITKTVPCDSLQGMTDQELVDKLADGKILFDFGSSALKESSYKVLDVLVELLRRNPALKLELSGHTDAIGPDKSNQTWSENRALAAKQYVISRGINGDRLTAKGYGETTPIATNKTEEGRGLNRRVEFRIVE